MPGSNCVFAGCSACHSRNRGLSFHRLPRNNPEWKSELLHIIRSTRADPINIDRLTMCSRHFEDECFSMTTTTTGRIWRRLKPGSLPTRHLTKLTHKLPARKPLVRLIWISLCTFLL
ncbi:hypothetical protein SNE40_006095 [Patella caerulea]|uniref:THAP-type domain-containing protein n=1 Tax=Patella caerulea TaxID=87958 RepID=A0AAN8QAS6_PATCE